MKTILVDTRESLHFTFERFNVQIERAALPVGDYSIGAGSGDFTSGPASIAIERKSLADLVQTIQGDNRARFERELQRGANTLDRFAVVIESSIQDVWNHNYRSRMEPKAVLATLNAFFIRYGIPFIWAGTRNGAEWVTFDLLSKYYREIEGRFKQATKGQGQAA